MEYIVVRGAGDLATGVIQKLHRAGFRVVATETAKPTAVRRFVALCECVYTNIYTVEDITAKRVDAVFELEEAFESGFVPVIVDPECKIIEELRPLAVVDAIIAKKNLGTHRGMAPITIALGPGFRAPKDVDCVIETMRGHNLGRLIFNGEAFPNTGEPGDVAGVTIARVMHSEIDGKLSAHREIGDLVKPGDLICEINGNGNNQLIFAKIGGVLRGLLSSDTYVRRGMKIGDIDPRLSEAKNCRKISDKSRNLGGAVLEAVLYLKRRM